MVDANQGRGDFEGWTERRLNNLLIDLLNGCFSGIAYKAYPDDFYFATCTVNLADYRRAEKESSGVRSRKPEALCAFHVAAQALMMLPDNKAMPTRKEGVLELWFDRNEPFRHHVYREWQQRKNNRRDDVVSHIAAVPDADYRDVIGLQAADFVAWHTNRYHVFGDDWAGFVSGIAAPNIRQYWEYENLIRAMPDGWTFTPKEIS